jgi:hypothetical protein
MRQFWSGVLVGLGVGWLVGWSLGVSGLVPDHGWPLWAATVGGILLIGCGTAARQSRRSGEQRPTAA